MEKVTLLEPAKDEVRVKHTGDIKLNIPQVHLCIHFGLVHFAELNVLGFIIID